VIVTIEREVVRECRGGRRPFRFEAEWLNEEQCASIVENAWKLCTEVRHGDVKTAVGEVAKELGDWSRNVLGDLEKRIKKVKRELENCRRQDINSNNVAREHLLKYKLEKLEEQKDTYWRQRAHAHWLKYGTRIQIFFHKQASERRRQNRIKKLVADNGGVITEDG
jgi:hypothetical protein